MGIALLHGREFEDGDGSERVIVNENLVRTHLGGEDPIGYRITGNGNTSFEIVGVVKDSASIGLRDLDQQMMYVPGGQRVLHVRAAVPPATLTSVVEAGVLIAIGIAIGAPSAFALGRTLQGLLFGVQPADAATAAVAICALGAVAFASAWMFARRAARVDTGRAAVGIGRTPAA